jgi:predicted dehydrogenase
MTRLAVIGAGSFGKNHVRVVRESSRAELRYVVDSDIARAREYAGADASATVDFREVIGKVDAAILAVPTVQHAEIGCTLLEAGVDVLVEKPIATTLEEADRLVDAAERNGSRVLQVGHLERFNPAVIALERAATLPLFFEIHRMSVFTLRSLDVDVVLDLMIHDLDIVLALARAELIDIRAAGISVLSPKVDIANVRLEFADGCIANLTASRVSTEKVRKLRLFQPRQYISLDYATQSAAVFKVGGPEGIAFEQLPVEQAEPLKLQLDAFLTAVETRSSPKLNGRTSRQTLKVALAILDKIKRHTELVEKTLSTGWKP